MNEFRGLEKDRFVVSFILEDTNLNLMQNAKEYPKKGQIEIEPTGPVM